MYGGGGAEREGWEKVPTLCISEWRTGSGPPCPDPDGGGVIPLDREKGTSLDRHRGEQRGGLHDESKSLAYRHILKNTCESSGREIQVFVFFLNLIQVH